MTSRPSCFQGRSMRFLVLSAGMFATAVTQAQDTAPQAEKAETSATLPSLAKLPSGSLLLEIRNEQLGKELNLSDEQQAKIESLRAEFRAAFQAEISETERQQTFDELEQRTVEVLDEKQKSQWDKHRAMILKKLEPKKPPAPGPPAPEGTETIVSFDAPAGNDAQTDGPRMSFNFQFAPWTEILEDFAKRADLTLDLTDTPPGTFSYRDSRSYTPTQALDVLNGYLLPRGYILVRRDRFLVSLSTANGIPPNLAPQITEEELPLRGRNELVSLVIPVRGLQADLVVEEVRQLLGPQGKASALKNTNSIVVTDIGSHVRRVHGLLAAESSLENKETAFKAIPLKHITASEAERTVRRLFGLTTATTTAAVAAAPVPWWQQQNPNGGGPFWGRSRRGDRGGDRGGEGDSEQPQTPQNTPTAPPVQPTASGASQFANKIQVAANNRTNQLLVTASSALIRIVEDTVLAIDTDVDIRGEEQPLVLRIYSVPGGDLANIAQTINMIVPGVVLGQDAKLGKLHIQATAEEHKEVSQLIDELSGEGTSSVAVIHLQKMEPVSLANTLTNLFAREGARAPHVEADPLGRRLIIRGTPDQLLQVKAILTGLGEGDGLPHDRSERGTVRSLKLGGRDPDELLPLLKDAWTATRPNPIRLVVPSLPKPIRTRSIPGASNRSSSEEGPHSKGPNDKHALIRSATFQQSSTGKEGETDEPAAIDNTDDADVGQPSSKESPISIEVVGDQIIVTSPDEKALDRLEELYERISAAIPARTKWHVFYLRSADATEAAQMIEKLFPQSNVAATTRSSDGLLGSFAGGINNIGRGLMNVSGLSQTLSRAQSLRIVTDLRANALFVTGPSDQIAEVEQILEVLDASELPDSLRDRMPRTIAVEHADVEEVASVVEAVFKDAMTPENPMLAGGQRSGGFNPLMMLMGGAASQPSGGRRQPSVQLTVGVDRRTNHLIVSCNDSLYQQIQTLVEGIDDRAKQSRQTVRVVKLDQADPTLVQQTLGSLIPKVTVGTTRRSQRSSNNSESMNSSISNPPATNSSAPTSSGEPFRDAALLQRMMMERAAGNNASGDFRGGRGSRDGRGQRSPRQ